MQKLIFIALVALSFSCQKKVTASKDVQLEGATKNESEKLADAVAQTSNTATNTDIVQNINGIDINALLAAFGLSPAQAVELLTNTGKQLFKKIDKDGSNTITAEELNSSELFQSLPATLKTKIFDLIFSNSNSGEVDFQNLALTIISQLDIASILKLISA